MTRRRSLLVVVAALALLGALDALLFSLYRSDVRTIERTLDDRLVALGTTSATWLASAPDGEAERLLAALVAANHLEDAYVVDGGLHVIAGVRTRAGSALNLLRIDDDRFAAALAGHASAGAGYSVGNARVQAAYFPITGRGATGVLALEAGAEYHAATAGVRTTFLVALGLSVIAVGGFVIVIVLALRALDRARLAYGRAERLVAVGQMAAMVAHEVRNPLGILRGQVELARERLPADAAPRERERFAEMLAEIDRINRLTEEFLGLARDVPLRSEPVDLVALAGDVAADARTAVDGARLEVSAPASIEVSGDRDKLRQALRNLVLNAVQVGGPGVHVRLVLGAAGDGGVRITISDDGPGIPIELASSLFEPFVTGRRGGSGLGLAIARRIVERHGGTLELASPPGERGATFSIHLPRKGP